MSDPIIIDTTAAETKPDHRAATSISPKVSGGLAAGAVATLVVFTAQQFGVEVPTGVEGALAVLIGAIAGYFIPDNG